VKGSSAKLVFFLWHRSVFADTKLLCAVHNYVIAWRTLFALLIALAHRIFANYWQASVSVNPVNMAYGASPAFKRCKML